MKIWWTTTFHKAEIARESEIIDWELEAELLEFTEQEFQALLENSVERMKK
jgi:hypothetical protein